MLYYIKIMYDDMKYFDFQDVLNFTNILIFMLLVQKDFFYKNLTVVIPLIALTQLIRFPKLKEKLRVMRVAFGPIFLCWSLITSFMKG